RLAARRAAPLRARARALRGAGLPRERAALRRAALPPAFPGNPRIALAAIRSRRAASRPMSAEGTADRGLVAGIAATSAALLMTELVLTRIFSVTMFYHFAFLAISIALLGLSASGVFVYVARRRLAN